MTDAEAPILPPQPADGPQFRVLAQYVKDLSFENPRAPESLRIETKPEIEMGVEMNARGRSDGLYEVDLDLQVKATVPDGALFAVQLVYGGIFQVANVSQQDLEPLLLTEAPRYLFPFARQIVAACTSDGGFYPPFLLEPIDFAAIYESRRGQVGAGIEGVVGNA